MELAEFCQKLAVLEELTNAQKAVAVLWFLEISEGQTSNGATSGELAALLRKHSVAHPNSTHLARALKETGCVYCRANRFTVRQNAKETVRSWLEPILDGVATPVDPHAQFLPEAVWKNTRGYIEKVCEQLNGCYFQGYYDGAAVLMRRFVETLIIEAYEHLNRESEIKAADGNYLMLGDLVGRVVAPSGLSSLGRETKRSLADIKKLGDRSAHNRRYNARKADLEAVRDGLRLVAEELLHLAQLYHV